VGSIHHLLAPNKQINAVDHCGKQRQFFHAVKNLGYFLVISLF
jgi:hypothetical protein